jgi:hypothetical protein
MLLNKGSYWSVVQRTEKRKILGSSDKDSSGVRVLGNIYKIVKRNFCIATKTILPPLKPEENLLLIY